MNLASRGLRDMDTGKEKIEEADIQATIRRQAQTVVRLSFVYSLIATLVVVLIPF